ncbi:hypothetical protein ACOSQ4_032322 [Xanthoceras sorbifolium]
MKRAKIEMEIRAMDRYKASPTFDAFMHREFRNDINECRELIQSDVSPEVLHTIDLAIANNVNRSKVDLQHARKVWRAHCWSWKLLVLDMHIEIPKQAGMPKAYGSEKSGSNILGSRVDTGPDPDVDYELSHGNEDIALSEKKASTSFETDSED